MERDFMLHLGAYRPRLGVVFVVIPCFTTPANSMHIWPAIAISIAFDLTNTSTVHSATRSGNTVQKRLKLSHAACGVSPTPTSLVPPVRFPLDVAHSVSDLLRWHCHTHRHTSSLSDEKSSPRLRIAAKRHETRRGCTTHCAPPLPRVPVLGCPCSQYHRRFIDRRFPLGSAMQRRRHYPRRDICTPAPTAKRPSTTCTNPRKPTHRLRRLPYTPLHHLCLRVQLCGLCFCHCGAAQFCQR
ncbi:hypothetical protein C8F01DRAFT_723693 [Mycena amicta]|nr:hypothetical protein C8F01DRAFT_723693 [Mycena amicta]